MRETVPWARNDFKIPRVLKQSLFTHYFKSHFLDPTNCLTLTKTKNEPNRDVHMARTYVFEQEKAYATVPPPKRGGRVADAGSGRHMPRWRGAGRWIGGKCLSGTWAASGRVAADSWVKVGGRLPGGKWKICGDALSSDIDSRSNRFR